MLKSCHASLMYSPNLRAANRIISRVRRSESSCRCAHSRPMDGEWLGRQQCLYLRPLAQGEGSFLLIFSWAWKGITLRRYPASPVESKMGGPARSRDAVASG